MVKYFKELLYTKRAQLLDPIPDEYLSSWDKPVILEEINISLSKAKKGKSVGLDTINTELVHEFHKVFPEFLPALFNKILQTGIFPESWSYALIVLIHKKGAKSDLNNYRGISLLSATAKLFCSVINNRITEWAESNGVLSSTQLGFRKGNRTSDALIILHNLIDRYCRKNRQNIFGCFVDFRKAFDKVPRDKLINKISRIGIGGNVLKIIRSMYTNDYAVIKLKDGITSPIEVNQGVRQGCVLSPTLFNLYMSDFESLLSSTRDISPVSVNTNTEIPCLLWADDILLLSAKKDGLQNQLCFLEKFAKENLLEVNEDKTKTICFNRANKLVHLNMMYSGKFLEDVDEYVYLGFLIKPNGDVSDGIKNLQERALKSFYKIKKAFMGSIFRCPDIAFRIFDSIIKPVALYASDFWGLSKQNIGESPLVERIHISFCKWLLGVGKRTSNAGVFREVFRTPIALDAQIYCLENWARILGRQTCNSVTYESVLYTSTNQGMSYLSLEDFLKNNYISSILKSLSSIHRKDKTIVALKLLLRTKFWQENKAQCISSPKLSVLSQVKMEDNFSHYIMDRNIQLRARVAKLRLSDHRLEAEVGRYNNTVRAKRICKLCNTGAENVPHFLLLCEKTREERDFLQGNMPDYSTIFAF